MAVTFRAAGSVAAAPNNISNPTNLSPGLPTRSTDDLLVCLTFCRSITATVATPSGWTLASGFPLRSATASGGSWYIFLRVVDGSETAPSISWSGTTTGTTGDSSQAVVLSYSGVDISGGASSVLDGTPTKNDQAGATTTATIPSITTSLSKSLRIAAVAKIIDASFTWTPPSSFTERIDSATTSGTGHGLEISDVEVSSAGSTGTTTAAPSNTTSARALGISLALKAGSTVIPITLSASTSLALEASDARATQISTDSPEAWWRFNEDSGASSLSDETGHGHSGTPANGVTLGVTGSQGNAVTFDGANDQIATDTLGTIGSNALTSSWEFWIKTTSTAFGTIFGTMNTGTSMIVAVYLNSSTEALSVGSTEFHMRDSGGGTVRGTISTNIYDGNWHHIVWVVSAANAFTVYVDGVSSTLTYSIQGTMSTDTNFDWPLGIGYRNNRGTAERWGAFTLDDFAVYPTRLTSTQVADHYNASTAGGGGGNGLLRTVGKRLSAAVTKSALVEWIGGGGGPGVVEVVLAAGTSAAAALTKRTGRPLLASVTGALGGGGTPLLTGTSTLTGTGVLTSAGDSGGGLLRQVNAIRTSAVASGITVGRAALRSLSIASGLVTVVPRSVRRTVSASTTSSVVFVSSKLFLKALSAASAALPTLPRSVRRSWATASPGTASVRRNATRTLNAPTTTVAFLVRRANAVRSVVATGVTSVRRAISATRTAVATEVASVTSAATRTYQLALTAASGVAPSLRRVTSTSRAVATGAVSLVRRTDARRSTAASTTVSAIKGVVASRAVPVTVVAYLTKVANLPRSTSVAGVVALVADRLTSTIQMTLTAVLSATGSVRRSTLLPKPTASPAVATAVRRLSRTSLLPSGMSTTLLRRAGKVHSVGSAGVISALRLPSLVRAITSANAPSQTKFITARRSVPLTVAPALRKTFSSVWRTSTTVVTNVLADFITGTYYLTLTAVSVTSASVRRAMTKTISVPLSSLAVAAKRMPRSFVASVGSIAAVARSRSVRLSVAVSSAPRLARQIGALRSVNRPMIPVIVRAPTRSLLTTVATSPALARAIRAVRRAGVTSLASIVPQRLTVAIQLAFSVVTSPTATLKRATAISRTATTLATLALSRFTNKTSTVAAWAAPSLARAVARTWQAALDVAPSLGRLFIGAITRPNDTTLYAVVTKVWSVTYTLGTHLKSRSARTTLMADDGALLSDDIHIESEPHPVEQWVSGEERQIRADGSGHGIRAIPVDPTSTALHTVQE